MPFITGQATTYQGLLDALTTALAANGWAANGICWSKNGCHVSLEFTDYRAYGWATQVSRPILRVVAGNGVASGALTDPAPQGHALGTQASLENSGITFPATYCIHINTAPDEVYFFVNYNLTFWQWLAFGQSPVAGLPGTGNWAGGTFGVQKSGFDLSD
ncbi:hypothetical protein FACS1894185_4820 [Betaproteobacteria bacterium]|nr:hypothetical protein FACS1894185_4820 [Betaproteobacteria bacterium]